MKALVEFGESMSDEKLGDCPVQDEAARCPYPNRNLTLPLPQPLPLRLSLPVAASPYFQASFSLALAPRSVPLCLGTPYTPE